MRLKRNATGNLLLSGTVDARVGCLENSDFRPQTQKAQTYKTQTLIETSDLENSLVSKMRLKSIDPLQREQKLTASLPVGGNAKPSAYVSSCFLSVLAGCSSHVWSSKGSSTYYLIMPHYTPCKVIQV